MPQIFSTGTSPEKKRDVVKEWPDFEEKGYYRVLATLKRYNLGSCPDEIK